MSLITFRPDKKQRNKYFTLCEQAGFSFKERHYRKLTTQSFWRVIYRQKYPNAPVLDKEDILVFVRL